jgi:hypothetical protein
MRRKDFYTGSGLPEDNSPMYCVLVLVMSIDVAVVVVDFSPMGASTPPFISKGARL